MLNLLRARECGFLVSGLDNSLHARWTMLQTDYRRTIDVSYSTHVAPVIDFDSDTGELLLTSGENEDNNFSLSDHVVAIYRRPHPSVANDVFDDSLSKPIGITRKSGGEMGYATSATWLPGDAGLFVLGMDRGQRVSIWDTAQLECVEKVPLVPYTHEGVSQTPAVLSVKFSSHPQGRTGLLSATCAHIPYAVLVDVSSGTATHELRAPEARAPVHDVAWSPTFPHHVATVSVTGEVSLFDIRRSGTIACLMHMSAASRRLPRMEDVLNDSSARNALSPQKLNPKMGAPGSCRKRPRTKGPATPKKENSFSEHCGQPLGLKCNWLPSSKKQQKSLCWPRPRIPSRAMQEWWKFEEASEAMAAIRYTHDGSTLVSFGRYAGFLTHDVLTGCLISSLGGLGLFLNPSQRQNQSDVKGLQNSVIFDVTRDDKHIVTAGKNHLKMFDIMTGELAHQALNVGAGTQAFTVHPKEEEVYTSGPGRIFCWSVPKSKVSERDKRIEIRVPDGYDNKGGSKRKVGQ